jgi:hypothetical protein
MASNRDHEVKTRTQPRWLPSAQTKAERVVGTRVGTGTGTGQDDKQVHPTGLRTPHKDGRYVGQQHIVLPPPFLLLLFSIIIIISLFFLFITLCI